MAATTKTLTPTNQVISIPAFTDKPDNRLQTDSTDKLADAVNALDSKIIPQKTIYVEQVSTFTLNIGNNSRFSIDFLTNAANCMFSIIGYANSSGAVSGIAEKYKGDGVTFDTSVNKKLTVSLTTSRAGTLVITASRADILNEITLAS